MTSIKRTDLLALSNLRNDGRKGHEIRRTRIQMGCSGHHSGSAIVQMGLTSAMATVSGPIDCSKRSEELPDRAVLDVKVRIAPFAAASGDRRYFNPNTDRRLLEHANLIQRAMEASILMHLHARSKIELSVVILADDGGRLCAAINAATCALIDAGIPLRDFICACSAGFSEDGHHLVDLNREEINQDQSTIICACMPQRDNSIVLCQCQSRLSSDQTLLDLMDSAVSGCQAVFQVMSNAIRQRAISVHKAHNGTANIELNFQN